MNIGSIVLIPIAGAYINILVKYKKNYQSNVEYIF